MNNVIIDKIAKYCNLSTHEKLFMLYALVRKVNGIKGPPNSRICDELRIKKENYAYRQRAFHETNCYTLHKLVKSDRDYRENLLWVKRDTANIIINSLHYQRILERINKFEKK